MSAPEIAALLPPALHERLLGWPRRQTLARGRLHVGRHRTPRAGHGTEFREQRAYVPGDDVRQLDWRAIARRDRLVLRQREAESEHPLIVLVDGGPTMGYGEGDQRKFTYARRFAAGLAWLACADADPVGFCDPCGELPLELTLRPSRAATGHARLAQALDRDPVDSAFDWERVLAATFEASPRGTTIAVLSDLLDPAPPPGIPTDSADDPTQPGPADRALRDGLSLLRTRVHSLVVVQVLHRDELDLPWSGPDPLLFHDIAGRRPPVEGGTELRDRYREALQRHLSWWDEQARHGGFVLHRVVTDTPIEVAFPECIAPRPGPGPRGEVR